MNSKDFDKAKQYAFLLLKFRLRSEKELFERLKKKKFSDEVAGQVVAFLKERKFIDDESFAKAWITSRIKRPLGIRRLKQELELKGVDRMIIRAHLEELQKKYSEKEVVSEIVKNRLDKLRKLEPEKAKRRVYSYLLRRGFSPEVVIDAISRS